MESIRSDIASEIVKAKNLSENDGIIFKEYETDGIKITDVSISDSSAEQKTGKPQGEYITVETDGAFSSDGIFTNAINAISDEIKRFTGDGLEKSALIVGLGNISLTADALGVLTAEEIIVTRHIKSNLPKIFSSMQLRETSVFIPGVLGKTGTESAETVKAIAETVKPDFIIVIDALASRHTDRLCSTVQISNTGICPGSGVGNARAGINKNTVGVPVISVGIPTVVDAVTLAGDIFSDVCENDDEKIKSVLSKSEKNMIVTPRDIDVIIKKSAHLLSTALNKALHGDLSQEEINALRE